MAWKEYIVANPAILAGKPTIKGTRISVEFLLALFGSGWSYDEILDDYPHLTREQIQAALEFAAEVFTEQREAAIARIRAEDGARS